MSADLLSINSSGAAAGAASAYARVQGGASSSSVDGVDGDLSGADGASFGSTLQRALQDVVQTGQDADTKAAQGITGDGNITDVVMAVSRAQLALQSTTAIRDRVVQAYQDIMKMSI